MPKGWPVGPFAERQERKQGTLPKRMSGSATLDLEGCRGATGRTVNEKEPVLRKEEGKRGANGRKAEEEKTRENKAQCLKQCQGPQGKLDLEG